MRQPIQVILGCGSWGTWSQGEVLASPYPTGPRYLTVLTASRQHYGEDAMSFGDTDDCGWVASAVCRPATDEEATPLIAAETERQRKADARRRVGALARRIQQNGERPEGEHDPEAEPGTERLLDTQTIYGGGNWFVATPTALWYVQNNGADGDDWRANNVRTGGAGAIGWRANGDPELERDLRDLERVLDPEAPSRRKPSAQLAYERFFSHVNTALWTNPQGEPIAPPSGGYVHLTPAVIAGIGKDGGLYLATSAGVDQAIYASQYRRYGYLDGRYALALRYEATPERLAAVRALWPTWTSPEMLAEVFAAWLDPATGTGEPARVAQLPPGQIGRYKLPGHEDAGWAASARDALYQCVLSCQPVDQVEVEAGMELVHVHRARRYLGGQSWALWSDGAATVGECHSDTSGTLPDAASALLGTALRQQAWRTESRWRALLTVVAIEQTTRLDEREDRGHSSGQGAVLDELLVRHTDGRQETLYRLTTTWWAMGEDGDAGEDVSIYRDRAEAERSLTEYMAR